MYLTPLFYCYDLVYDNAGNLTRDKNGYSYAYDYENRLVEIRKTNDTITVATFAYDAFGRRIEKVDTTAGSTKRFYYDDQRIALQVGRKMAKMYLTPLIFFRQ